MADLLATASQLWRLNETPDRLRDALERSGGSAVTREVARQVLSEFMPNTRRPPAEPSDRALIRELNRLEHRARRRRR